MKKNKPSLLKVKNNTNALSKKNTHKSSNSIIFEDISIWRIFKGVWFTIAIPIIFFLILILLFIIASILTKPIFQNFDEVSFIKYSFDSSSAIVDINNDGILDSGGLDGCLYIQNVTEALIPEQKRCFHTSINSNKSNEKMSGQLYTTGQYAKVEYSYLARPKNKNWHLVVKEAQQPLRIYYLNDQSILEEQSVTWRAKLDGILWKIGDFIFDAIFKVADVVFGFINKI